MNQLTRLLEELRARGVRYVAMGVWGANHYAKSPAGVLHTRDKDLFLPLEEENLIAAWQACEAAGLSLCTCQEPLDLPRDLFLARAVVSQRALTRATGEDELLVDLSLVMAGFAFDEVWSSRRHFQIEGTEVAVARLMDIVRSKAIVGRPKDRLFLETLKEELRKMEGLGPDKDPM